MPSMWTQITRALLHPVTSLLHTISKEMKMRDAETIAALAALNDGLSTVDANVAKVVATINKVGTETASLLTEVQTLTAALAAAQVTSPEVLDLLAQVTSRVTALSGHVADASTAADAVDAAVPDAVAPVEPPADAPVETGAPTA